MATSSCNNGDVSSIETASFFSSSLSSSIIDPAPITCESFDGRIGRLRVALAITRLLRSAGKDSIELGVGAGAGVVDEGAAGRLLSAVVGIEDVIVSGGDGGSNILSKASGLKMSLIAPFFGLPGVIGRTGAAGWSSRTTNVPICCVSGSLCSCDASYVSGVRRCCSCDPLSSKLVRDGK